MRAEGCSYFPSLKHTQLTTSDEYGARYGNADQQEEPCHHKPVMRGEMERKEKTQVGLPSKPSSSHPRSGNTVLQGAL